MTIIKVQWGISIVDSVIVGMVEDDAFKYTINYGTWVEIYLNKTYETEKTKNY